MGGTNTGAQAAATVTDGRWHVADPAVEDNGPRRPTRDWLSWATSIMRSSPCCVGRGPRESAHLKAFNIASAKPLTLNELAGLIADEVGVTLPSFKVPVAPVWGAAWLCEMLCKPFGIQPPLFRRRVGFFTHNRAFDLSRAEKELGYESQWPHDDGIQTTIQWYRKAGWI